MALSDTAEYWWWGPKMPYMGKQYIHIPNSTCGHIKPETGNTDVSEYLNDVNCFACLKLLEQNGNIYGLKEGTSKREQSKIDKEKHRFRYGKCECGSPMTVRKNSKTGEGFLGCVNYPKCKKTKRFEKP
jgi:hypothetical protein